MTHNEIIEWIDDELATSDGGQFFSSRMSSYRACLLALRAVVEFHKPFDFTSGKETFTACYCGEFYPCPTIQAIEEELNGQI